MKGFYCTTEGEEGEGKTYEIITDILGKTGQEYVYLYCDKHNVHWLEFVTTIDKLSRNRSDLEINKNENI